MLMPVLFQNELSSLSTWGKKKINSTTNFLRGGAFKKKEDEEETKFEPKVNFDDLVGLEQAKETLSLVLKYIEDPERFDRAKLTPEKGYLLTGPTRTGKSFTAEALAGEIKKIIKNKNRNPTEFGFYVIKASYIIKHGIAKLLDMAKKEAPCVLFIDEIDLLGLQRAGGNKELLGEFLLSMSGCLDSDPNKQVIILAATNKPENLDEALKQRGRFGKEIRFEYPGFTDRKTFLFKKLDALSINLKALDLDKLAKETEGSSFEDLNAMVKKAFQKAKIKGEALNQACLEESLNTEIRNIMYQSNKELPEHEKQLLAIHQAGHALATMLLESHQKIALVTILPILSKLKEEMVWDGYYKDEEEKQQPIEYGKIFTYHDHDTLNAHDEEEKIKLCKISLAGHVAEKLLLRSCGYSYHLEDKQRALQIAKSIVMKGIKIDKLPEKMQNKLFEDAFALLDTYETQITKLLEDHKDQLHLLATTLREKEILSADELYGLLYPEKQTAAQEAPSKLVAQELGFEEVVPETAQQAA